MYKRRPLDPDIRLQLLEDAHHVRLMLSEVRKATTPEAFAKVRKEVYRKWFSARVEIVNAEREFHWDLAGILERAKRLMADNRSARGGG